MVTQPAGRLFFSGLLIILFKEISQPDRGKLDCGEILIVDLGIRVFDLAKNFHAAGMVDRE
jgi:hypothetical protein